MPNAPDVVATANSSTQVTVTWTETVPPGGLSISSYKIFRGTSPNPTTQVATRATLKYIDNTVVAGTTYYYTVEAVDTVRTFHRRCCPAGHTVTRAVTGPLLSRIHMKELNDCLDVIGLRE